MVHLNPTISIIILKVNGLLSKDGSRGNTSQLIFSSQYYTDTKIRPTYQHNKKRTLQKPKSFMNTDEKNSEKKYQQTASRNTYTKRIIHHDQLL